MGNNLTKEYPSLASKCRCSWRPRDMAMQFTILSAAGIDDQLRRVHAFGFQSARFLQRFDSPRSETMVLTSHSTALLFFFLQAGGWIHNYESLYTERQAL